MSTALGFLQPGSDRTIYSSWCRFSTRCRAILLRNFIIRSCVILSRSFTRCHAILSRDFFNTWGMKQRLNFSKSAFSSRIAMSLHSETEFLYWETTPAFRKKRLSFLGTNPSFLKTGLSFSGTELSF